MSREEWDSVAWWEQRALIEGLQWEGVLSDGSDPPPEGLPTPPGVTDITTHTPLSGDPGEFAALGFREESL